MPEHESIAQARETLRKYGKLDETVQRVNREEIVRAFEVYWYSNPRRADFVATMNGVVLFTDILFIMVKSS